MNIFVINGSPKGERSNTYQLTKAFLEGIKQEISEKNKEEEIQVEEVCVTRLDIKHCLGCFSCWGKTPGKCCLSDDMGKIIEQLLWADVTIWSFPLYYYTVPGGLKNLIDRQLPMVLPFMVEREDGVGNGSHPSRYDMSEKKTVVISTCGFYTAEGNYDGVRSLFDHMCGKDKYTAIFCGQGELFRVPELRKKTGEYLEHVKQAGREYIKGGIAEATKVELERLLYPREVFESMADASWGIEKESGKARSEAFTFTKQMAALYCKESYNGKDQVLEMYYTDLDECYQVLMGKEGSQVLEKDFQASTTRIETPFSVWKSIAAGEIRGDEALMKQLYKVKGDFNLMLNWDSYFGGGKEAEKKDTQESQQRENSKKTNMSLMLIPWIVFWVAASINPFAGSLISIFTCAVVPLLFFHNKKTIYDILSGTLVTGLSIAVLMGGPVRLLIPLSYLAFGVMWTMTCLVKIPLTANYSMNGYGGEEALKNPLFIKTNRILTFIWGILYLLTPIWTYFIMGTQIGYLTGAVNSVLPAFMGLFTLWFQKWYPAKVARGD